MAKDGVISGNARSKNPVFSAFAPSMDSLDPFSVESRIRKEIFQCQRRRPLLPEPGGHRPLFSGFSEAKRILLRGVDIKEPEYPPTVPDEFILLDLLRRGNCLQATRDVEEI
jgi:hypothetical protein